MKRIILYLIILSVFTGCATYKRCNTRFPCYGDTVRIETIKDSIIYKDTIVYIKLPGETVTDSVIIPCPEKPGYVPKKVHAETSLAYADAWWKYPNIQLKLVQKDTTIEKRLDNAIKEAYHWQSEYNKINVIKPPEKYVPKFVKFLAWTGGLFILSIIGYVLIKIFNPFKFLNR